MGVDLFRPLGRAGLAWRSLRLAAGRGRIWAPLCILALARLAAILVLFSFHVPWLASFGVPLVHWLGGEAATHYPQHFFALPAMFAQAELLITVLVASIALGASVVGFAACYTRRELSPAWQLALRAAPHLMLLSLLLVASSVGSAAVLDRLVPLALPDRLQGPGEWAAQLGIDVLVQAVLAYAIAAIVLLRRSILGAISLSFRLARRNPLTTLLIVGVPALLLQLAILAMKRWNPMAIGLTPEWITAGVLFQVLLELLLAFVVLGSTTRVFLSRVKLGP